jgi:hypothetical protein
VNKGIVISPLNLSPRNRFEGPASVHCEQQRESGELIIKRYFS